MADYAIQGLPGVKTSRTATPRRVMLSQSGIARIPGGKICDGSKSRDPLNTGDVDVLRAGVLMGEITASGKYAPSVLGVLTVAYDKDASAPVSMTVSAATATEIARRIGTSGTLIVSGPPTTAGTVATETITFSAVNTTTGVITISAGSNDFISGSWVKPTDGSQAPKGILNDGYGLKVTDADDANIDVPLSDLIIGGQVDTSQIVNVPSDTSLLAYAKAQLRLTGQTWMFDDDF